MNIKTINRLLTAGMIVLTGAVMILSVLIYDKSKTVQIENAKNTFADMQEKTEEEVIEEQSVVSEEVVVTKKLAETTTRVNIRNMDSEDGKVLETVEAGAQFEFVEVLGSGWTKIVYDGQDGYINSKFVKLVDAPEEPVITQETEESDMEEQGGDVAEVAEEQGEGVKEEEVPEEPKEQSTTSQENGDTPVIDANTIFH